MNNNKKITKFISTLGFCTLLSTNSYAVGNGSVFAVGPKIGTTGIGIDGRSIIYQNLSWRLGVNYFHYNHKVGDSQLDYKGKLTLLSIPVMLDYHPIDNSGFRISLGVGYNGNKVVATAAQNKSVTLYGHTYTPRELGTVTAKLTLGQKVAPVLSVGYDSSFISDGSFTFNAELGAMYSGNPKIRISATGLAGTQQQAINDVNNDANRGLNNIKKYLRFFPVISVGFKYNF